MVVLYTAVETESSWNKCRLPGYVCVGKNPFFSELHFLFKK